MADSSSVLGGGAPLNAKVTDTLEHLMKLKGQIAGADATLQALIGKLKTIKMALSRIQVWARNHDTAVIESEEQFGNYFTLAKQNAELAIESLEKDLSGLLEVVENTYSNDLEYPTFSVWDEDSMTQHDKTLRNTASFLQILVEAVQW
jgi:hypothetical protein